LAATPHRPSVLAAKIVVVILLIAATATLTIAAALAVAHLVLGDASRPDDPGNTIARSAGAALYWTLMALLATGITVLTRSGIIPLIVLIANSSLVSVSLLLTKLTPAARYLPDLAGMRLFANTSFIAVHDPLDPLAGGIVMTTWTIGVLILSAVVFTRRDA
jgi:ABC-2 type transport system permease protein